MRKRSPHMPYVPSTSTKCFMLHSLTIAVIDMLLFIIVISSLITVNTAQVDPFSSSLSSPVTLPSDSTVPSRFPELDDTVAVSNRDNHCLSSIISITCCSFQYHKSIIRLILFLRFFLSLSLPLFPSLSLFLSYSNVARLTLVRPQFTHHSGHLIYSAHCALQQNAYLHI